MSALLSKRLISGRWAVLDAAQRRLGGYPHPAYSDGFGVHVRSWLDQSLSTRAQAELVKSVVEDWADWGADDRGMRTKSDQQDLVLLVAEVFAIVDSTLSVQRIPIQGVRLDFTFACSFLGPRCGGCCFCAAAKSARRARLEEVPRALERIVTQAKGVS